MSDHVRSEEFQDAISRAPVAVLVVDEPGLIVALNRQAEELFGYADGVLLGQSIEVLIPEARRTAHAEHRMRFPGDAHQRVMEDRDDVVGRRSDGTEFQAAVGLSPAKTGDSWLTVVVVRDRDEYPTPDPEWFVRPPAEQD